MGLGRKYKFGSDPEVFLRDSKGQILPAFKFLPPKTDPLRVGVYADNCKPAHIYNDGFQAELSAEPHGCVAYVVDSIRTGLYNIWKKSNGASLVTDNAPMIPLQVLKETPDEYIILGCDPSRNAYHMGGKVVDNPRELRHRFTGWHVHISGWQVPRDYREREKLFVPYVKAFDAILGVFFVAAGAHLESKVRREYYGLAGEYRLPEHGLEYRVLSSIALAHPGITNLAFEIAKGVCAVVDSRTFHLWVADEEETIGIINSNNQKAARKILKRNEMMMQHVLDFGRYGRGYHIGREDMINATLKMGQEGLDSWVKEPNNFIDNWKFKCKWCGHGDGVGESWYSLCK